MKNKSIRVAKKDLIALREKALNTGVPYQTIINSLLHQYVKGDVTLKL